MELREIRTFLQIAQKQSFSKAAEALGYSQAAVTVQIKQLEEELGIHLFDRLGKKTVLTHHGEIFYRYAVTILGTVADAKKAVSASTELSGDLTIGTIESICESIFPDLLKKFHQLYPNVSVSIVLDSPDVLLDRMNKNSIDLVYLLDQPIDDKRFIKVLEAPENISFVSSSVHTLAKNDSTDLDSVISHPFVHPFAGNGPSELSAIIGQPFLLTEKNASYRFVLDRYLASLGKEIKPFLEIGNTEFIINMLKQNAGISFLPEFAVRHEVESGILSILPVKDFHMELYRQVLYHKDKWHTGEMDAFIELAKETFRTSPVSDEHPQE